MKKLFYLLIGILLILPNTIKADMAAPIVIKYKAIVNNPNGVDDYDTTTVDNEIKWVKTGKKIPYGTIFEIDQEDVDYMCNDDYCAKYSDLVAIEKDYKLKPDEIGEESTLRTIKETNIKSGPAQAYETIGKIKSNETIKAKRVVALNEAEEGDTPWFYIEYNGIKGYISELDDSFVIENENKTHDIMITEDTDLLDLNKEKIKTFKTFEIINAKVYKLNDYNDYIYIESKNFKGFINSFDISIKSDVSKFKANEEIKVYEYANQYKAKVIATLPKDTIFTSEYYYTYQSELFVYYEKDNIKGFAFTDEYGYDEDDIFVLGSSTEENNEDSKEEVKEEIKEEIKPKEEETKDDKKEEKNVIKAKKDYTLYICIGAGILVAITAIVTIILVNQKKKEPEL